MVTFENFHTAFTRLSTWFESLSEAKRSLGLPPGGENRIEPHLDELEELNEEVEELGLDEMDDEEVEIILEEE